MHESAGVPQDVCGADRIDDRIEGETMEIMAVIGQQDLDRWL
jgi:hypothetical protein